MKQSLQESQPRKQLSSQNILALPNYLVSNLNIFAPQITQGDDDLSFIHYEDQSVYHGQTNDRDERHGLGKLTWPDGSKFEGHWLYDLANGHGEMVSSKGTYKGEFANNYANGSGTFTSKIGVVFTGMWKDDC